MPESPASRPALLRVRDLELRFGERSYVMGIVNVTPDSFSGDGLLRGTAKAQTASQAAIAQALRMFAEGADIVDVGGESTRPGHDPVSASDELERVVMVVSGIRARLPGVPISIDTSKPEVAAAALAAGADIVNDVAGVTADAALAPIVADHGAPYILMHSRAQPVYEDVVAEVIADLDRALSRAVAGGCDPATLIVDPGIGFGKTAEQNLAVLGDLAALRSLGRPILLGASRKSTIGKVLDLPVEERLEGTLATTALGIAAGADIVRVHDVAANLRTARMSDAIIRGGWRDPEGSGAAPRGSRTPGT
ncbi:MAG: dihydropteroate synthase [Planctomycetota bacterium]|nr:MAG: dihydropteroate synthase [Planctomycetota bacterium]